MKTAVRLALSCLVGVFVSVTLVRLSLSAASASEPENMPLECSIKTSVTRWSKGNVARLTLSIANKSNRVANFRALPSIRLISVPSATGEPVREFWAPFDLARSGAAKDWHDLNLAKGETIRREISVLDLQWSPVESSLWPGKPFAETIPNGQYKLRVQIDLKEKHQPIMSNDVVVSLSD